MYWIEQVAGRKVMGYSRRGRPEGGGVSRAQTGGVGAGIHPREPPLVPSLSPEGVESRAVDGGRGSWEACLGDGIHFPVATMCEMKIG